MSGVCIILPRGCIIITGVSIALYEVCIVFFMLVELFCEMVRKVKFCRPVKWNGFWSSMNVWWDGLCGRMGCGIGVEIE